MPFEFVSCHSSPFTMLRCPNSREFQTSGDFQNRNKTLLHFLNHRTNSLTQPQFTVPRTSRRLNICTIKSRHLHPIVSQFESPNCASNEHIFQSIRVPFGSKFSRESDHSRCHSVVAFSTWREAWKLSDGKSSNHWRLRRGERPPLSDDGARRVIKEREIYERQLRRSKGPDASLGKRWISRTPDEMQEFLADGKWQWRWRRRYSRCVEAAISAVRQTAQLPPEAVDMRKVMSSFINKLSFRDMCVVLKEQRGWRQAQVFFEWMKLQMPYNPSVIAYTILLNIYGQAGKFNLAEDALSEMLDEGLEPDEVTGGCMIQAYARWDRHEDMLEFYGAMRQRGLVPLVHIYRGMIVSLYKAEMYSEAIILWEDLLAESLEPNGVMHAMILNALRKEGRLEEAVQIFEDMLVAGHEPDEISYNIAISTLGKLGRFQEAVSAFQAMKSQGIIPSKFTYTTMMNICSKAGDYENAAEIITEMQKMGCVPDEVVYCTIINVYGKVGLYDEAEKVFEELVDSGLLSDEKTYTAMANVRVRAGRCKEALKLFDVMSEKGLLTSRVAWNTLLHCYVKEGDIKQATKVFDDMVDSGVSNIVAYGNMMNLYARFGMVAKAQDLQAQMQEVGVKPDESFYGTLVKLYCNVDQIENALIVVQEMEEDGFVADQVIATYLIQAYGRAGQYGEAEHLFKSLDNPDGVVISTMFTLYGIMGKEEDALALSQSLRNPAVPLDNRFLNQLLVKHVKAGELQEAEALFVKLVDGGNVLEDGAAALLIELYGERGNFEKAMSVFIALRKRDSAPSLYLHNTIIKICIKCTKLEEAEKIFEDMEGSGVAYDGVTISILLHAFTKAGRHKSAAYLAQKAKNAGVTLDTVAYNTMLKANLESGNLRGAINLFKEMQEADIKPSIQTYSTLISIYAKTGDIEKAAEAFEALQSSDKGVDEKAYSHMIHCYGTAGRYQEAADLFREMEIKGFKPHEVTYNNLVGAYARAGCFKEAETLREKMIKQGCLPSTTTYLLLISAYGAKGKGAAAESVLSRMQGEGLDPDMRHYTGVIQAYGRARNLRDAQRVFSNMKAVGIKPDLGCYRTLIKIYLKKAQYDEGLELYEEIRRSRFTLDQNLYNMVVDLYLGAHKHVEANEMITKLESEGFLYKGQQGPMHKTVTSVWRRLDNNVPVVEPSSAVELSNV